VSKRANLRLFERVGIDVAISARGAAVASVLHQIRGDTTRLLAVVEEGLDAFSNWMCLQATSRAHSATSLRP